MDEALLDTDILSEVLKAKDRQVLARAQDYLAVHQRFAFSAITFYEILRGLLAKHASRQLSRFLMTAKTSDILPSTWPCSSELPNSGPTRRRKVTLATMRT
jgi:tRNA(fMet)-specific endonuclease VapC